MTGASHYGQLVPPVSERDHSTGDPHAPVTLVEYGDYECPHCGHAHPIVKSIQRRLGKKLRFVFRNFPLAEAHPHSRHAAEAAEAAADQGKFWEMHDALFFNQDRWSGETTSRPAGLIADLARGTGVNMDQFNSCVESRKYDPQIRANQQEAERRQVGSTPTFLIGNKKVASAVSYDEFKRHVDEALQARTATKTQ